MPTEQSLPITEMLEIKIENIDHWLEGRSESDVTIEAGYRSQIFKEIIPQIRTLEEAQQKKAKEEEIERIVGIIKSYDKSIVKSESEMFLFQNEIENIIERITSDNQ